MYLRKEEKRNNKSLIKRLIITCEKIAKKMTNKITTAKAVQTNRCKLVNTINQSKHHKIKEH